MRQLNIVVPCKKVIDAKTGKKLALHITCTMCKGTQIKVSASIGYHCAACGSIFLDYTGEVIE